MSLCLSPRYHVIFVEINVFLSYLNLLQNQQNEKISLQISLVGTPFPLIFLIGNAVPMRSRPTTPLYNTSRVYNVHVHVARCRIYISS